MSATESPHTIVLGAGPVGLAAALLLTAQGHRATVYEGRDELVLSDENSYPIGVNARGQETLRRIDPDLLARLRDRGEVVEAFHIYAGTRRLSRLESGRIIATTRAFLTSILFEKALTTEAVTYVPGHRLTSLDVDERTLTFSTSSGEDVVVDARDARVIAADGVWSAARRSLAEQRPEFAPRIGEWGVQFRVAYSQPHASAPGMDPAVHHIFTSKGIYTATLADGVWGVALTAIAGDESEALLLSSEASEENVRALRAHVQEHAPLAAPLLTHDDYVAYFSREPFGGAVVRCPRLACDEWLLLVGDAAHSVLPPTGEGVNSGLEDALLSAEHAATGSPTWFAHYEAGRLPDLEALGEYAWTLRENIRSDDPARDAANLVLRVGDAAAAKLHLPSAQIEARLFGPASDLTPYREVIGPWLRRRRLLYPAAHTAASAAQSLIGRLRGGASGQPGENPRPTPAAGPPMRLTVVGGSHGTGRALTEAALQAGHDVTVVSRSGIGVGSARVVTGDATDPDVARAAVTGADAVVITVGGSKGSPRIRADVTAAVIAAMQEEGVTRLVVQSSLGVGGSERRLPALLRVITSMVLAGPLADHEAQESLVRDSGLEWTIVRPAGLTNAVGTGTWRALRDDDPGTLGGRVTRADVAGCLLACLTDPTTIGHHLDVSG